MERPELLNRFIQQVLSKPDTPSIIQLAASDSDFLALCGAIANASPSDQPFFDRLTAACRRNNTDFARLKEKLDPVAFSLGLAGSASHQVDYYELLGVAPDADFESIKRAYRQKAREVHPDANRDGNRDSGTFVELNQAYHTLTDSVLRSQYDKSRQHIDLWYERPPEKQQPDKRLRHIYHLVGFFLFLVVAAFVFDFLFQEIAITGISLNHRQSGQAAGPKLSQPTTDDKQAQAFLNPKSQSTSFSRVDSVDPTPSLLVSNEHGTTDPRTQDDSLNTPLYRVTIFYSSPGDREALLKLSAFLEAMGYRSPALVRLRHHRFGIHYFNSEDKDRALVFQKQVNDYFTKELGLESTEPVIEQPENADDEGRIELWIESLRPPRTIANGKGRGNRKEAPPAAIGDRTGLRP